MEKAQGAVVGFSTGEAIQFGRFVGGTPEEGETAIGVQIVAEAVHHLGKGQHFGAGVEFVGGYDFDGELGHDTQ